MLVLVCVEFDMVIVSVFMLMGFSENGSKRVAFATNNAFIEVLMEWVFVYMEDVDFNELFFDLFELLFVSVLFVVNLELVMMFMFMGFGEDVAEVAFKACVGNLECVVDWLFLYVDDF